MTKSIKGTRTEKNLMTSSGTHALHLLCQCS